MSSDSDQDRILTAVEYEREGLGSFGVTFAGIDADADGLLTLEDYVEPYERHHDSHDQSDA